MTKRILAILCTLAMVTLISVSAFAAEPVWRLGNAEITSFVNTDSSDYLQNCGGGSSFAKADGDKLVFSGGRTNDYDVVDFKVPNLCDAGKEYTFVITMSSSNDTSFRLMSASDYSDLVTPVQGKSATLTYKFKDPKANFRFQIGGDTGPFTIESAVLWEGDPPAESATGKPGNPKTGDNSIIFIALSALALAGFGAFVLSRKSKNN